MIEKNIGPALGSVYNRMAGADLHFNGYSENIAKANIF